MSNYSVLMSVYYKENPQYLIESIESMLNQSIITNDFVIVCDGKLPSNLSSIISKYKLEYNEIFNIVYLEKNVGLGNALNIGMKYCKNNIIARMDSDDISLPNRCEKQIKLLNHDIDIVGCNVKEFINNKTNIVGRRIVPENSVDIVKFSKKRNPFNHPSIMYKKDAVLSVGGYKDYYRLEDYYLWIRMLNNNKKSYNIQEDLLLMRASEDMYKRRGGICLAKQLYKLRKYMLEIKYINKFEFINTVVLQSVLAIIPNSIRRLLYNKLLRN